MLEIVMAQMMALFAEGRKAKADEAAKVAVKRQDVMAGAQ